MTTTLDSFRPQLAASASFDAVWRQNNCYAEDEQQNLIAVSLSGTDLETLILDEKASKLQYLCLQGNTKLSKIIFRTALPNLEVLDISDCALSEIELPAGCDALRQLYLQGNELKKIRWKGVFPALQLLDASRNKLEAFQFPEGTEQLAHIYLNNNALETVDYPASLPALATLHLAANCLREAPAQWVLDTLADPTRNRLTALYLAGNAPKNIPKAFLGNPGSYSAENCLPAAQTWFNALEEPGALPNKVVKLMLTGNGNAGKTSLLCALKNGKCTHDPEYHRSTHGIQLEELRGKDIQYHVWDFGGQEVYHGTHRLFMAAEALQIILFDPETELRAHEHKPEKDRVTDEMVRDHPLRYWFETSRALSPESRFLVVQNKKDKAGCEQEDADAKQYAADNGAEFVQISALKGGDIPTLQHVMAIQVDELPEYNMLMPASWVRARDWFIQNLEKGPNSQKIISKARFDGEMCAEWGVGEDQRALLFQYLHHNGFLYYDENLKDNVIADQRWALEAIYKPLDRKAEHFKEFRENKGRVRVRELFAIFDLPPRSDDPATPPPTDWKSPYTIEDKRLFLSFMESCNLFFQLNDRHWQYEYREGDILVFPEFLPEKKPATIGEFWKGRRSACLELLYPLPWTNYTLIQSFIGALGRKTQTDNIWRFGIHIETEEGYFMTELDYDREALVLHIDLAAAPHLLENILKELNPGFGAGQWLYAETEQPFDLESWKRDAANQLRTAKNTPEEHLEKQADTVNGRLKDVPQQYDGKPVILFVAANPPNTNKLGTQEKELAKITRITKGKFEVYDVMQASAVDMNNAISQWKPTIVHFCGHAEAEGIEMHDTAKRSGKRLDFDTAGRVFQLFKQDFPELSIVFLNACFTENTAKEISHCGLFAFGTTEEIHSTDAISFAEGFYFEYSKNHEIIKSVRHGMRQTLLETGTDISKRITLYHNGTNLQYD